MERIVHVVRALIVWPIKLYQYVLSPYLGACCRFYPSCSHYAIQAVHHHGALKGLWLAAKRIMRCHPWSPGGYDPVLHSPAEFKINLKNKT